MFDAEIKRLSGANVQSEFIYNIYEGENLETCCAMMHINPAVLALVREKDPDFDLAIRRAQAFRVDIMTDKLENIEDYHKDAKMAKVVSDNIKWLASKRMRDIYGDKVEINHNHTISLVDAIKEARNRTMIVSDDNSLILNDSSTDSQSVEQPIIEVFEEIDPLS